MKTFEVSFGSRITGSHDYVVVMAESEEEAMKIGKPMLNTHKLSPDFLNSYGRYDVVELSR